MKWLLRKGAKISHDKYGKTPMNDAAENEQLEVRWWAGGQWGALLGWQDYISLEGAILGSQTFNRRMQPGGKGFKFLASGRVSAGSVFGT